MPVVALAVRQIQDQLEPPQLLSRSGAFQQLQHAVVELRLEVGKGCGRVPPLGGAAGEPLVLVTQMPCRQLPLRPILRRKELGELRQQFRRHDERLLVLNI